MQLQGLPRDSTRYMSAALRLRSGFAPPSAARQATLVVFWDHHGAVLSTAGFVRLRSSRNNHIITCDRSYVCVINLTTWNVLDRRISRRACICLFFESCMLVSTQNILFLKSNRMFRCMTSCLLGAKFSWIATSCSGIHLPDCRSWDGADTQRSGPGGS